MATMGVVEVVAFASPLVVKNMVPSTATAALVAAHASDILSNGELPLLLLQLLLPPLLLQHRLHQ